MAVDVVQSHTEILDRAGDIPMADNTPSRVHVLRQWWHVVIHLMKEKPFPVLEGCVTVRKRSHPDRNVEWLGVAEHPTEGRSDVARQSSPVPGIRADRSGRVRNECVFIWQICIASMMYWPSALTPDLHEASKYI